MRASELLGPEGPFARAIEGYELRPSQMRMADAVEDALADDGLLLVEAGTGTGKTLAYLVPAVLSGRKVVVSTGSRALQDQIMEHDLPALERHLGLDAHAVAMKGLGNYLCLRRYDELRRSAAAVEGPLARHLPVIADFRERTLTGDRAELEELPEDAPIWSHVASGSDTRIGPRCRFHDECFVTRVRRRADQARIVVVNHHLFFADLAMRASRGVGVLPDYEAVIFDEAHQIEDVATLFFGASVSSGRVERFVQDAVRSFAAAETTHLGVARTEQLGKNVLETARTFFERIPTGTDGSRMPLAREDFSGELERALFALDDALEAIASHATLSAASSEAVAQIARRAGQLRDDLLAIAEGAGARRVCWSQRGGRTTTLGASPVSVADVLRDQLFHRKHAVVLTSATLSTGGDLSFVKQRLGVTEADERLLASPFRYDEQAALYLAGHMPDPRAPAFLEAAAREVRALVDITGGGAFVLCTSNRSMQWLGGRLRADLDTLVMVQGEAPKTLLLERFRAHGHAVLVATMSFWEGVDVPGDALRLVVLEKLPFDVPSDPLVAARCERLRVQGESPFSRYLVPAAALTLKQGFGRLVRSARDRGIVAILDSRIVHKSYGKAFLASLPDASRCYSLDEVRAFHAARFVGAADAAR